MKIYLLALFGLLASPAFAEWEVHEVANRDAVSQTISVSSYTRTNVTSATSTGTVSGAFLVEVYNTDSSDVLNCGFSVSLSTISSEAWYGREVRPLTGVTFQINPSALTVYCMTQDVAATTRATITQLK